MHTTVLQAQLEDPPETIEQFAMMRHRLQQFEYKQQRLRNALDDVDERVRGLWQLRRVLPLEHEINTWRCKAWPKWLTETRNRTQVRFCRSTLGLVTKAPLC